MPFYVPFYVPRTQRRPHPEPLRTDDRRTIVVGTAVWAVLLVVSLVVRDDLAAAGRSWWTWSCVAGVALGLVGLLYLHQRDLHQRATSPRAGTRPVRDRAAPERGRGRPRRAAGPRPPAR